MMEPVKFEAEHCPMCKDGIWVPHTDGVHQFKHFETEYSIPSLYYMQCNICGTHGFNTEQVGLNQKRIRSCEAGIYGFISHLDVNMVRAKYYILREDAAKLYGVHIDVFNRWEAGDEEPPMFLAEMMKSLLNDSVLMQEVANKAGISVKIPEVGENND